MTVTHARTQAPDGGSVGDAAHHALVRARDHLLGLQHEQGWWQGELETNVTMDAEDLLMRHFLGVSDAEHTAAEAQIPEDVRAEFMAIAEFITARQW